MKKFILLALISIFNIIFFCGATYADSGTEVNPPKGLIDRGFTIDVGKVYMGIEPEGDTIKERAEWALGKIIQMMMIGLGVISILVMTIGAGFMMLHSGDDSLLSKGKTIFTGGIYAVIVALASYYIIDLIKYLLY